MSPVETIPDFATYGDVRGFGHAIVTPEWYNLQSRPRLVGTYGRAPYYIGTSHGTVHLLLDENISPASFIAACDEHVLHVGYGHFVIFAHDRVVFDSLDVSDTDWGVTNVRTNDDGELVVIAADHETAYDDPRILVVTFSP